MSSVPSTTESTIEVRHEDGSFWATVREFPGVFASGDTEDELLDSVREAIRLYLDDGGGAVGAFELLDPTPATADVRMIRKTLVSS